MGTVNQPDSWQARVARKREECANRIPSEWKVSDQFMAKFDAPISEHKNDFIRSGAIRESGILTDLEINITEGYTIPGLISALATGSLTSVEVTLAYCKRAAVAQQLVCGII